MGHILKWKKHDYNDKELKILMERIWGAEFFLHFKLENLTKQKTWLETNTMFCDECYLVCVEQYTMTPDQINGEEYAKKIKSKLLDREREEKENRDLEELKQAMEQ